MTYDNLNNNFKKAQLKKAFSLIELSVVVLIIGILIAGITAGSRLVRNSKLASAAQFTKSSDINSIPDLVLWLEPTQENSFSTTSSNTDTLTYSNVAGLQDASYLKDTLRPDNREYVARWNDITPRAVAGNKKSVYQETGSRRPMYIANAINGLPALQFDGSSQYLYSLNNNTTPSAPPLVAGDDSYTMIAVFSPFSGQNGTIIDQFTGGAIEGSRKAAMMLFSTGGPGNFTFAGHGQDTSSGLIARNNDKYIGVIKLEDSAVLASNNIVFYLNTSPLSLNATLSNTQNFNSTLNNVADGMFTLGVRATTPNNENFNGLIGEVMVFDRALKNEELDTIMKYLSKKWGIALQ